MRSKIRTTFPFCLVLAISTIFMFMVDIDKTVAKEFSDTDVIAKVNGKTIEYSEYRKRYKVIKQQFFISRGKEITPEEEKKLKTDIIENLVTQELIDQKIKEKNIEVTDKEVKLRLADYARRMGGIHQLEAQAKKSGIDLDDFKIDLKKRIGTQKLISQESEKDTTPSEEEMKKYYEEHASEFDQQEAIKAGHILVKLNEDATKEDEAKAREKIQGIQDKLKSGLDFEIVAKDFSEGPSAARGGNLGWVTRGKMVPEFEEALFTLKAGEISDVVRTKFGLHVIKAFEIREPRKLNYEESEQRIALILRQKALNEWIKKYLEDLRKNAEVEILM